MKTLSYSKFALVLASSALALSACKASSRKSSKVTQVAPLTNPERRPDVPAILSFMPNTKDTKEVLQAVRDEVGEDYDVIAHQMSKKMSIKDMDKLLAQHKPTAVILMNNPTVRLYKKYQASKPKGTKFPPAVILMSAFLEDIQGDIKNSTGISYEVPGVTTFVRLRTLLDKPIKRVGVIYRPRFENFIQKQRKLASMEKFEIVGHKMEGSPSAKKVKAAIKKLRKQGVNALWILNDNLMLKGAVVSKGWMPSLQKNPLPVIVGVGALVREGSSLGSFAILPDHAALGVQAASIIFELEEEEWDASERGVDLPISVRTVIQIDIARKYLAFKEESIDKVDKVIGKKAK